jgi:uncharacterized RDD family membrane protein YckC
MTDLLGGKEMALNFPKGFAFNAHRAEPQTPRANVIPIRPKVATQPSTPSLVGRPRLSQRLGAEIVNRVIPWLILSPALLLPLWIAGASSYLLFAFFIILWSWHLCCDGAPSKPSLGKRLAALRIVSLNGQAASLVQKVLRRSGTVVSQTLYCLVFLINFPASTMQSQAESCGRWLLAPLHWFGYAPRVTALLMLLAMAIDALNLVFIALNPHGRHLGDYLAATQVVTKKAYKDGQ